MQFCFAEFPDGGILLDVRNNRYVAVSTSFVPQLCAHREGAPLATEVAAGLRSVGVEVADCCSAHGTAVREWSPSSRAYLADSTRGGRSTDAALAAALWKETQRFERLLTTDGFSRTLEQLASTAHSLSMSGFFARPLASIESVTRGYKFLEHWIAASPKDCVKRSLGLTSVCRKLGLPATFMIGVNKTPFSAHAWVESEGRVLNSTREDLQYLRPILAT